MITQEKKERLINSSLLCKEHEKALEIFNKLFERTDINSLKNYSTTNYSNQLNEVKKIIDENKIQKISYTEFDGDNCSKDNIIYEIYYDIEDETYNLISLSFDQMDISQKYLLFFCYNLEDIKSLIDLEIDLRYLTLALLIKFYDKMGA